MVKNLHQPQTKTASNLVMHNGTIMILSGIQEGFWPINNQRFYTATSDAGA